MDHRYEGKATFAGALHKMNKELTKAAKTLTSEETINGFTDKAQGAFAFDTVKKTVVKATSHEHGPPKEKHVQTLLSMAREKQNMQAVFQELFVRLRGKDATVGSRWLTATFVAPGCAENDHGVSPPAQGGTDFCGTLQNDAVEHTRIQIAKLPGRFDP
eukprot:1969516-Rhodomonas_salina.1